MLILTRKLDEVVMIGDDIRVVVVEVRGDKVRLAFDAPSDIIIHRKEVYDAIQRKNQEAAETSAPPDRP